MGMWQQLDRTKLKWESVTDETVRGMFTTHGDVYYNREHNAFWIDVTVKWR